jgi:hypothetical protein
MGGQDHGCLWNRAIPRAGALCMRWASKHKVKGSASTHIGTCDDDEEPRDER